MRLSEGESEGGDVASQTPDMPSATHGTMHRTMHRTMHDTMHQIVHRRVKGASERGERRGGAERVRGKAEWRV